MFEYLGNAIYGSFIANMIIGLLGVVASVAGSIVLDKLVFGPRAKDKNASKAAKVANGQHFLPLSFIRIGYYACAIYLVFLGISMFPLLGISGVPAFFGVAVIGNIVLHFVYELLLAARKNAGLDTDGDTAAEPKVEPQPVAQPYQQYQQPQQYQQMPQYQQVPPMPQQYQQPAPAPVPQPVPPMPQPAPAPVPQPVPPMPQPAPAPVPQPVPPMPQPAPAPVPQPVPPMPQPAPAPAPQPVPTPQAAPAPQAAGDMACPHCGKPMKAGAKFCPFCGKPTV